MMIDSVGAMSAFIGRTDPAAFHRPQGNPFQRADGNGDGYLDRSEAMALAGSFSDITGSSTRVDRLFSALDSNGDGLIDQREFRAGKETIQKSLGPKGERPQMMDPRKTSFQAGGFREFMSNLMDEENSSDPNSPQYAEWAFNNPLIAGYLNNSGFNGGSGNSIEIFA